MSATIIAFPTPKTEAQLDAEEDALWSAFKSWEAECQTAWAAVERAGRSLFLGYHDFNDGQFSGRYARVILLRQRLADLDETAIAKKVEVRPGWMFDLRLLPELIAQMKYGERNHGCVAIAGGRA